MTPENIVVYAAQVAANTNDLCRHIKPGMWLQIEERGPDDMFTGWKPNWCSKAYGA